MKTIFFICLMYSISSMAFYVECKNVSDKKEEVRIFQNNSNSDNLFLVGQTHTKNTPIGIYINMNSSKIVFSQLNNIHSIDWSNPKNDIKVSISISEDYLEDGREILWPIPYQAEVKITNPKDGVELINSTMFACRQFRNN